MSKVSSTHQHLYSKTSSLIQQVQIFIKTETKAIKKQQYLVFLVHYNLLYDKLMYEYKYVEKMLKMFLIGCFLLLGN